MQSRVSSLPLPLIFQVLFWKWSQQWCVRIYSFVFICFAFLFGSCGHWLASYFFRMNLFYSFMIGWQKLDKNAKMNNPESSSSFLDRYEKKKPNKKNPNLPITWSSEHNWLVPRSTIKGNQKYFGPWLFLNQSVVLFCFVFKFWRSQNQIMWSHRREIPPFHWSSHPLFLPISVRSEVVLDLSRTLLRISSGFQSKQVTMKGVLEVTRREAIVTSKADLETFSV